MNSEQTECPHGVPHRWPCEKCDVPQGEPVAVVYVADPIPEGTHGRWMSWLVNPVNLPNNMKLYAAPPADGVDVTVSETPRTGVLVPEGELAALRAEIEELKGQVNNRDNALETRAITLREVQSALMRETTAREEAERKLAELMKEGG